MPDNLRDAIQLLICERTYLIHLIKGLISRTLASSNVQSKPQRDSFLQRKQQIPMNKRELTPQFQIIKPFNNTQSPSRQILQDLDTYVDVTHKQRQNTNNLIDDILIGAATFINKIGSNLQRPSSASPTKLNHIQKPEGAKIYVQTNSKYNQVVNNEGMNTLKANKIKYTIETGSDDDESVDVRDSSSSEERSPVKIQTHQLTNKGVVNNNISHHQEVLTSKKNRIPMTFKSSASYRYEFEEGQDGDEVKIGNIDDEPKFVYHKSQRSTQKMVPIEDFICFLENTESQNLEQQEYLRFTQHHITNSNGTFEGGSDHQVNHFQKSIGNKEAYSKLHDNFSSISCSQQERVQSDQNERQRRQNVGMNMLMSRDSSFGVTGFKTQEQSLVSNQFMSGIDLDNNYYQSSNVQEKQSKHKKKASREEYKQPNSSKTQEIKPHIRLNSNSMNNFKAPLNSDPLNSQVFLHHHVQNANEFSSADKKMNTISTYQNKQSTNDSNFCTSINTKEKRSSLVKSQLDINLQNSDSKEQQSTKTSRTANRSRGKWKEQNF